MVILIVTLPGIANAAILSVATLPLSFVSHSCAVTRNILVNIIVMMTMAVIIMMTFEMMN